MDLNADGRHDVLSGSSPGPIHWFRRNADGSFAEAQLLRDKDGNEIFAGSSSTVFAVDWDADKDLDLLLGAASGKVFLAVNHSGGKELEFGRPTEIATVEPLKVDHQWYLVHGLLRLTRRIQSTGYQRFPPLTRYI